MSDTDQVQAPTTPNAPPPPAASAAETPKAKAKADKKAAAAAAAQPAKPPPAQPSPAEALAAAPEEAAPEAAAPASAQQSEQEAYAAALAQQEAEDNAVDATGFIPNGSPIARNDDGTEFFVFRTNNLVYDHDRCAPRARLRGLLKRIDNVVVNGTSHYMLVIEPTVPTCAIDTRTGKLVRVEASAPNARAHITVPWPNHPEQLQTLLTPAMWAEIEIGATRDGYMVFLNPKQFRKNLGGQ
jgi:hypothetical protein